MRMYNNGRRDAGAWTAGLARMAALCVALLLVAGCAIKLAPDYDASIVQGLQKANEEAMVLFAGVSGGTVPATFAKRADAYASVIGKLDALKVAAGARLDPSPPSFRSSTQTGAPTPQVVEEASGVLSKMRERDQSHGLSPMLVVGFRNAFAQSMQQALIYERALER